MPPAGRAAASGAEPAVPGGWSGDGEPAPSGTAAAIAWSEGAGSDPGGPVGGSVADPRSLSVEGELTAPSTPPAGANGLPLTRTATDSAATRMPAAIAMRRRGTGLSTVARGSFAFFAAE
jgi:hypothetical protein